MKQVELREGAKRQHRTIALLGIIQSWHRGLDALCFQRKHIERLVGIEKFRDTRVQWLREDLREYFPYIQILVYSRNSFASIFASRVPLSGKFPTGKMNDEERSKQITKNGIPCEVFSLWSRPKVWDDKPLKESFDAIIPLLDFSSNYDERLLTAYLDLLARGSIAPSSVMTACRC